MDVGPIFSSADPADSAPLAGASIARRLRGV